MTLTEALGLRGGIVAAVGAGGKKSLLLALARELPGRVAWTATAHTAPPPRAAGIRMQVAATETLIALAVAVRGEGTFGFAQPSDKPGRLAGLAPADVDRLHTAGGFDTTLVKADGARMRGIKAPKADEPLLPPATACVLVLVSAGAIGQPLDDRHAHRAERLAALLGLQPGEAMTAAHVGALLAAEEGGLQHTAGMRVVPVINQVDDAARREAAEAAARAALAASPRLERVVLTRLRGGERNAPLVGVITRQAL